MATRGAPPADLREWISFEDPHEQRTWIFDVTFLTSAWSCIYGAGCPGIRDKREPELELGCCNHGAHFTDDTDRDRVLAALDSLSDDEWQLAPVARRRGVVASTSGGAERTRVVEGGCIALNRPGFGTGAGCALHQAALRRGERPMDLKPEVCWQLPLRRVDEEDEHGWVTSTVREWRRRDWGGGGDEFHWWCTEEPEAFVGAEPVYRAMADELRGLVGHEVYELLAAQLDRRRPGTAVEVLPHPVRR